MNVFRSDSPLDTKRLGKELGETLTAGDIVLLDGDLGTGKTVFTSGIAEALGCSDYITSPTYNIVNEHRGLTFDLFHIDVYRLDDPEEIIELGLRDYLNRMGIVVIEWAERVKAYIRSDCIEVMIEKCVSDDNERRISISYLSYSGGLL